MNKQSETVEQVAAFKRLQLLASQEYNDIAALVQEGSNTEVLDQVPEWARLVAAITDPAVLELVPGVKELREENERLKDFSAEIAAICLDHMPVEHATLSPLDAVRRVFKDSHDLRSRIASLEQENERLQMAERVLQKAIYDQGVEYLDRIASLEQQLAEGGEAVAWMGERKSGEIYLTRDPELLECWEDLGWKIDKLYTRPQAQPSIGVAEGWKLVPVEPTEEMIAALSGHGLLNAGFLRVSYIAMLSAAPVSQEVGK